MVKSKSLFLQSLFHEEVQAPSSEKETAPGTGLGKVCSLTQLLGGLCCFAPRPFVSAKFVDESYRSNNRKVGQELILYILRGPRAQFVQKRKKKREKGKINNKILG